MINKLTNKTIIILLLLTSFQLNYGQKKRAMWIWNSANQVNNIINDVMTYRSELFNFCNAPHGDSTKNISVLFFSCREAIYSNSDNLRNFLSFANDSGYTIEYLDGDPSWATYNQDDGYDRINKVIEFNDSSSSENEKIKGIQFDVEPYLLKDGSSYQSPYWDVERMVVWESFLTFLDSCQKLVDNADSNLYFGVAIPRWYENHVGLDELKRLQSIVDYVAIMDYNEKSSVIINDAENEINNAEELNKKVWIGVETKEVSPETVSFYEEGNIYMENELSKVWDVYGSNDVFNGFAIHSYRYYKVLIDEPVSVDDNELKINLNPILKQNYPNPFNPSTQIDFYLAEPGKTSLIIYNLLGEKKISLINQELSKGWHSVQFNNVEMPSGVYIYELSSNDFIAREKMVLLK